MFKREDYQLESGRPQGYVFPGGTRFSMSVPMAGFSVPAKIVQIARNPAMQSLIAATIGNGFWWVPMLIGKTIRCVATIAGSVLNRLTGKD